MSIPLLNLDDRNFADLVEEMRILIPRYTSEWTDFNYSDPGIMLLELFAWLTEATIYRVNRIPASSRMQFLRMLGAQFQSAQPSQLRLKVTAPAAEAEQAKVEQWTLPRGTLLGIATRNSFQEPLYETLHDVTLTPWSRESIVTARQITPIEAQPVGETNGAAFQLVKLPKASVVLPDFPFPIRPVVCVDGDSWDFRKNFQQSGPDEQHFVIKPWLNAIAFGDGKKGAIPPAGAPITITYRSAPTSQGILQTESVGISQGRPSQLFRLSAPFLTLDLQEPDLTEPEVSIDGESWRFFPNLLEMGPTTKGFVLEPWCNAIRFGNGVHGQLPDSGHTIRASYCYAKFPTPEIPVHTDFVVVKLPDRSQPLPSLTIKSLGVINAGVNAIDLDTAHEQALHILKSRWRAITMEDVEHLVVDNHPDVARARCLPGRNADAEESGQSWPGHVSVAVVPKPRFGLSLAEKTGATAVKNVLAFTPNGGYMVAITQDGSAQLWSLGAGHVLADLGTMTIHADAAFASDGRRLLTVNDDDTPYLWDTIRGERVAVFPAGAEVQFSRNGASLVSLEHANGTARLHDAHDGVVIATLSQTKPVKQAVYDAGGKLLATTSADQSVRLWETVSGAEASVLTMPEHSTLTAIAFSPDSRLLATALNIAEPSADAPRYEIWLWQTDGGQRLALFTGEAPVSRMQFCPHNIRLLAFDDAHGAWLYSVKNRRRLAALGRVATIAGSAVFSQDGRWLAVANEDRVVRLWETLRARLVAELPQTAPVHRLAFAPNSQRLIIHSSNYPIHTLQLWELPTQHHDIGLRQEIRTDIALIDTRGRWLAAADDNLLHIWGVEAGKPISTLLLDRDDGAPLEIQQIANNGILATLCERPRNGAPNRIIRSLEVWNADCIFEVNAFIDARRLVTSQHHVLGPKYLDVCVKATVVMKNDSARNTERVQDEINKFFHPLHGGAVGTGWQWGRNVYASEIYQLLERMDTVDHVESLSLESLPRLSNAKDALDMTLDMIEVPPFYLVHYVARPGDISIAGTKTPARQNIAYRVK